MDGLDVRPVGVEHERPVVARVVLRALARRAVVPIARRERRRVERVDGRVVPRGERDVEVRGRAALEQGKRAVGGLDVHASLAAVAHAESERRRDRLVAPPCLGDVPDADPEVVDDVRAAAPAPVVDRLDAVAVGIEEERAVVGLVVDGPRAGLAVARVPRPDPGVPERVDVVARAGDEGDVQTGRDGALGVGLGGAEVLPLVEVLGLVRQAVAEGREHGVVERPARGPVRDAHPDVVEQFAHLLRGACVGALCLADEARAGRGPSFPRNARSIPLSEK